MDYRSTEQAVKDLMNTSLIVEQITPFLESANSIVTGKCLNAGYGAHNLELIERWLAAHLASSTQDRQVSEKKVGEASWKYSGVTGKGLDATPYGQQVKALDYKGTLADLSNIKGVAELKVIDI